MSATSRVHACSPVKLAVLVDGLEVRLEPPDNLVARWDLIAEQTLPGGRLDVRCLKGSPDGPPAVPEGFTRLATVRVPRGTPGIYESNIVCGPDAPGPGLPPYSGSDVRCPKCGVKGADTAYRAYGRCVHDGSRMVIGLWRSERLHRECCTCAYEWDEATAEQKPPLGKEE